MEFQFSSKLEEYYQKFVDLQEKLRKSEEQRFQLEIKFNQMVQIGKEEEQEHYRRLRTQYKRFLDEDKKRQDRNERILRHLERIETRISMLSAKTQRIDILRKQYRDFLMRITKPKLMVIGKKKPSVIKENLSSPPYLLDEEQFLNERHISNQEQMEILDKYLKNISSQKCRDLQKGKEKSRFEVGAANRASAVADDIMNSIYVRHYNKPHVTMNISPEVAVKMSNGSRDKTVQFPMVDSSENGKEFEDKGTEKNEIAESNYGILQTPENLSKDLKVVENVQQLSETIEENANQKVQPQQVEEISSETNVINFEVSQPSEEVVLKDISLHEHQTQNLDDTNQKNEENADGIKLDSVENLQYKTEENVDGIQLDSVESPQNAEELSVAVLQQDLDSNQQDLDSNQQHLDTNQQDLDIESSDNVMHKQQFQTPESSPQYNEHHGLETSQNIPDTDHKPKQPCLEQLQYSVAQPPLDNNPEQGPYYSYEQTYDKNQYDQQEESYDQQEESYDQQFYNQYGQPIWYDQHGQVAQPEYDENGQMVPQYDENGQLIMLYDQNGQPCFGEPQQYDESGYGQVGSEQQYGEDRGQELMYGEVGGGEQQYGTEQQLGEVADEKKQFSEIEREVEQVLDVAMEREEVRQEINPPSDAPMDEEMALQKGEAGEIVKSIEKKVEDEGNRVGNVMDILDTDTEASSKQNTSKVSNDSEFDFS
ncbi:involucrin [Euwallacea similis]|uniref:involucrin n=1 Tax=Euwallacea similis TaxID=1736056 RepID=UPI00344BA6CB